MMMKMMMNETEDEDNDVCMYFIVEWMYTEDEKPQSSMVQVPLGHGLGKRLIWFRLCKGFQKWWINILHLTFVDEKNTICFHLL